MRWMLAAAVVLVMPSCSFLVITHGARVERQGYTRERVKEDAVLARLGDHRCIAWQGWAGDTIAVVSEALAHKTLIGPPVIPLIPYSTGYGNAGDGAYGGEVSSPDRHWVSVLLTIAPGHSIALDPCGATWTGGRDTLTAVGMLRSDGTLDQAAFLPLPFRCDEAPGPMTWASTGGTPQRMQLMLCFRPGIHLEAGTRWTLRLPCTINGSPRIAEFLFHWGQWVSYSPITLVNG